MRGKILFVVLFIFVVFFSLSFASAFWPFDWFKRAITGNVVLNQEQIDSLKSDLVGWYRFDMDGSVGESSGLVHDWSGNGNDGTVAPSGAVVNPSGKFAKAYEFSGGTDGNSGYVKINNYAGFNFTKFTFSAWVYDKDPLGNSTFEHIIDAYRIGPGWKIAEEFGVYKVYYSTDSSSYNTWSLGIGGSSSISNAWKHIGLTFDGNKFRSYLNGNFVAESSSISGVKLYSIVDYILIGQRNIASFDGFYGTIDELMIFDRSLTNDEMNFIYSDYPSFVNGSSETPANLTCTDSDGGLSPYVLGNVSFNSTKSADVCLNSTSLKEYYCDAGNTSRYSTYSCSGGCSSGVCGNSTLVPDSNQTFSSVDKCLSLTVSVKSKVKSLIDSGKTLILEEGASGKSGSYFVVRPEVGGKVLGVSLTENQSVVKIVLTDALTTTNKYESIPDSEGKGNVSVQGGFIYYLYSGSLTSVSSDSSLSLSWGVNSTYGVIGTQKDTFNCNFSVSASTNITSNVTNTTVSNSSNNSGPDCLGCVINSGNANEDCIPFGFRTTVGGAGSYCDIDKSMHPQKALNQTCMNNFECVSNQCFEGKCAGVMQDIRDQASLLKKIWCWITNIVDDEGYQECLAE